MAQLDENKLHEFVGKMLGDLGGAFSVPTVRIGLRLGLFNALHEGGPAPSSELAKRAGGLTERYIREWALAQAANGFIDYDAPSRKFSPSPKQAMVFAVKDSPVYLAGAFDIVADMIEAEQKVEHSFRTGAGVRWGDSAGRLFCATGAFFRPGYVNNIVQMSFKEASAKDIKETGFDLLICFDCLHDMGGPRGCSGHMRRILKADGTWMIVEPIDGDRPENNMNPVGRIL
jgi:hypothetical protein